jgi:hypothetical protein
MGFVRPDNRETLMNLNDISRRIIEADRGLGEPPTVEEIRAALAQRIGRSHANIEAASEKPAPRRKPKIDTEQALKNLENF